MSDKARTITHIILSITSHHIAEFDDLRLE
jgi:hypothetical protein